MRAQLPNAIRRTGFTLVEILVVITILVLLLAIGAGAFLRIQSGFRADASRATVSKVDALLLRKLKMIRDGIEDDAKNGGKAGSGYPELTNPNGLNFNPDVARTILLYARTKNQLPMSFAEANARVVPFTGITLPRRSEFKGLPTTGTGTWEESAACLYAALSTFEQDGTEQQVGTTPNLGQKCYVDSYGKPIIFVRLAYNGDNDELNKPPFANAQYDPYFAKQRNGQYQTLSATTNLGGDLNANGTVDSAELWNFVRTDYPTWAGALSGTYPGLKNHVSCVISFGQQGNDVAPQPQSIYANANIVSYRLRKEGDRGE